MLTTLIDGVPMSDNEISDEVSTFVFAVSFLSNNFIWMIMLSYIHNNALGAWHDCIVDNIRSVLYGEISNRTGKV